MQGAPSATRKRVESSLHGRSSLDAGRPRLARERPRVHRGALAGVGGQARPGDLGARRDPRDLSRDGLPPAQAGTPRPSSLGCPDTSARFVCPKAVSSCARSLGARAASNALAGRSPTSRALPFRTSARASSSGRPFCTRTAGRKRTSGGGRSDSWAIRSPAAPAMHPSRRGG